VVDVSLMQRGIVLVLLTLHVRSTAPVSTKGVDRLSVKQVSRRSDRLATVPRRGIIVAVWAGDGVVVKPGNARSGE
jgi:hypothetical protein